MTRYFPFLTRVEIKLFSPCVNITDIASKDQVQLVEELKNRVVSLISSNSNLNFTVNQPQILSNVGIHSLGSLIL